MARLQTIYFTAHDISSVRYRLQRELSSQKAKEKGKGKEESTVSEHAQNSKSEDDESLPHLERHWAALTQAEREALFSYRQKRQRMIHPKRREQMNYPSATNGKGMVQSSSLRCEIVLSE
jgi:hypothetical protein